MTAASIIFLFFVCLLIIILIYQGSAALLLPQKGNKLKTFQESLEFTNILTRIKHYTQKESPFPGIHFKSKTNSVYDSVNNVDISISRVHNEQIDDILFNASYKMYDMDSLHISRETVSTKMKKVFGENDALTEDKDFDSQLLISTEEEDLLPLLNKTIRKDILSLLESIPGCSFFEITSGHFQYHAPLKSLALRGNTKTATQLIISICRELAVKDHLQKRLIDSFKSETIPAIRKKIIQTLYSRFPLDSETSDFLESVLSEKDKSIQILAAKYLGKKGLDHLAAMLGSSSHCTDDEIISILIPLRENIYPVDAAVLQNVFTQSSRTMIKHKALDLMRALYSPVFNPFLKEQLQENNPEFRLLIIKMLSDLGSLNDVELLFRFGKSVNNPHVNEAVRRAILQIQVRNNTGEKGWLSVNEPSEKEGGLSMADPDIEGGLSVVDDSSE
ncbi:MAG: hypothetical protein GY754_36630 [bacterium]|nr:hypothetical protein [bacterium]